MTSWMYPFISLFIKYGHMESMAIDRDLCVLCPVLKNEYLSYLSHKRLCDRLKPIALKALIGSYQWGKSIIDLRVSGRQILVKIHENHFGIHHFFCPNKRLCFCGDVWAWCSCISRKIIQNDVGQHRQLRQSKKDTVRCFGQGDTARYSCPKFIFYIKMKA